MSEGWAAFIAEHHAEETPAEQAVRLARQAAERDDRRDAQAEAERAAAVEDERDRRLLEAQQLGISGRSLADVVAGASRDLDEDAEYEAARSVMARIDRRREARARVRQFQAEQLSTLARAQAQRPDDPLVAAQRRAHAAFAEATRAKLAEAQMPGPEPRPFASRGAVTDDTDAQREGRAAMTGHQIVRVCAPGPDGALRNYGPDYGLAVR